MLRTVELVLPASESYLPGDFVVYRALPRRELRRVGGFVFLDHFDQPNVTPELFDVPPHPHIGLQTVTYLFEGEILHTDSLDNQCEIRPGDVNAPVLYEVERARDGGTFTTRRVAAIQHGEQIFNLAASFQTPEDGFEHQSDMPAAPDPETLPTEVEFLKSLGDQIHPKMLAIASKPRPVDIRWEDPQNPVAPVRKSGTKNVWMRAKAPLGNDVRMQQAALAYASDMAFMESALRPHGLIWTTPGLQAASLDHAMWFHHPFDFNDWTLFAQDSPSASQGRGLVRGQMFSRDGKLLASVAQECLMRVRK